MKLRKTLAAAGALAIAGSLAVRPAVADTSNTTVTFTVAAGALAFTAEQATASLGAAALNALTNEVEASANLGAFTVSDTRNSTAGWDVSASSTAVSQTLDSGGLVPASPASIAASNVFIVIDPLDVDATSLLTGQAFVPTAGTSGDAGGAIGGVEINVALLGLLTGNNTVTYDPTVTVTVPAGTPGGTYQTVVTQTVV